MTRLDARRFGAALFSAVLVGGLGLGLTGCPDNAYNYKTWTKKLDDPREVERAVTELEHLGNPGAIQALGEAWQNTGKPVRLLQVIIGLARPLTPEQADKDNMTDYAKSGRPASWKDAEPFLIKAVSDVDEANPRSVESAEKAAAALGEAKLDDGLDALVELANKPITKKLLTAQAAALKAIGQFDNESKAKAAAALTKFIDREGPDNPATVKDDKQKYAAAAEKYGYYLALINKALEGLTSLRAQSATKTLILAMYRVPPVFSNVRHALVATGGPGVEDALVKALQGQNPDVEQLFKDKKLDMYCGDKNEYKPDQCQPVSAKDFYPAVVLGDFYDPKSVPALLTALGRPAAPQAYQDDAPIPTTQYNAIFDALRKIGAPEAEATVHALWSGKGGAPAAAPAKGAKGKAAAPAAPAAGGVDINTKILAISAYPFLARDSSAASELAAIADAPGDNSLRQEAATAFARLSTNPDDIKVLLKMAKTQFDAADKQKDAAAKEKPKADAADKELAGVKKAMDDAEADALKIVNDKSKGPADIKAASEKAKAAKDAYTAAKKKHRDAVAPFKNAEGAAKDLTGYAHMFQTHIARIAVAMRCKGDIQCYAKTLTLKPEDAIKDIKPWVSDVDSWSKDEKMGVVEGEVERAMLEIGKQGSKASALTETLLAAAKSDDRLIRQSVLLALPKIAKVPCDTCEAKLTEAIKAGEGKTTLAELNVETSMMRDYFSWAGGKTPAKPAADGGGEAAAPAAPAGDGK